MALGIAIAGWGLVTRVRRRHLAEVLVMLAGAVLLVAVPLVQLLPSWGGAGLWILIAGIGILAVLVATFLEQGRTAIRAGLGRFSDETKEWGAGRLRAPRVSCAAAGGEQTSVRAARDRP